MRKMKKINGYLVVRFNDREKREYAGTGLGSFGVIDAEEYTGILDVDRSAMEYDGAETLEEAVEQARGLESELDVAEPEVKVTVIMESETETSEEEVQPEQLFRAEQARQEGLIRSGFYPAAASAAAAHRLSGYVRALEDLGMIDSFDERFMVTPETFQAVPPPVSGTALRWPWHKQASSPPALTPREVQKLRRILWLLDAGDHDSGRRTDRTLEVDLPHNCEDLQKLLEAVESDPGRPAADTPPDLPPGLEVLRSSKTTAEQIADIVSAPCPVPIAEHCDSISCRDCWLSWLTTGRPPEEAEDRSTGLAPTPPSVKGVEHEQDPEA